MGRNDEIGGLTSMRQTILLLGMLGFAGVLTGTEHNQLTPEERKEGYILLFNGKNLDGWEGDSTLWSVQDGAIVGSSDGNPFKVNTFLIYKKPFSDFLLKADIKLRNNNSGIHFRSTVLHGPNWIVSGYQADASDAGDRSAWGNFYEERGRSRTIMKTPDEGWQKAKSVVRKGDWNHYEILADGDHIRLTLNGVVTIDTTDDKASTGIIAIQLHSGEPMRVECRNIKLKALMGRNK